MQELFHPIYNVAITVVNGTVGNLYCAILLINQVGFEFPTCLAIRMRDSPNAKNLPFLVHFGHAGESLLLGLPNERTCWVCRDKVNYQINDGSSILFM